jgi:hypothetical protein
MAVDIVDVERYWAQETSAPQLRSYAKPSKRMVRLLCVWLTDALFFFLTIPFTSSFDLLICMYYIYFFSLFLAVC